MKESTDKNPLPLATDSGGTTTKKHKDGGFLSRLFSGGQTASVEALTTELEFLESKLTAQEQALLDSEGLSQELMKKLAKREDENSKLNQELETERSRSQKVEAQLGREISAAKASAEERGRQLADAKTEIKKVLSERNKAHLALKRSVSSEQATKGLANELASLRAREAQANKTVASSKTKIERLEGQLKNANAVAASAKDDLKVKGTELSQALAAAKRLESQQKTSKTALAESARKLAAARKETSQKEEECKKLNVTAKESERLRDSLSISNRVCIESSRLAALAMHRTYGEQIAPVLAAVWRHNSAAVGTAATMSEATSRLRAELLASGICQECEISEVPHGLRIALSNIAVALRAPSSQVWISAIATDLLRRSLGRDLSRRIEANGDADLVFHIDEETTSPATTTDQESSSS